MTKIFCQNCYELTHDVTKSVHDVNTSGRCTKCDSDAIIAHEVVAGAAQAAEHRRIEIEPSEDRWSNSPIGGRGRRCLEYNSSILHRSDIQKLLALHSPTLERWWDGHYFQLNYNFLYIVNGQTYSPTLDVLLENRDGEQSYITFEVTIKKLHPIDAKAFSANALEKTS